MTETKNEKFRRLATERTNAIIENLHQIGHLSNRNNYKYSDSEVEKMFKAIDEKLVVVKGCFERRGKVFKL